MKKIKTKLVAFFLSTVMVFSLLSGITSMSTVQAAGTAADVVALAQSQVGYHEKASNYNLDDYTANSGSANYNKYARDIGVANGQPWCATFVWWLMQSAGVPSSAYPSRTTVTRDWFNQRGLYHARGTYTPKPGDYVVFGNVEHCGIVESVSGGYVYTIEGNSLDQVKRNYYSIYNTYILGYGEISYNGASSTTTDTLNPGSPYPIPTGILRSGSTGDSVRWIQKFANDVMGAGISVDGVYGNQTINAVKVFQQQNGLTVDGIAGSQTISTMLSVWQNKIAASRPVDLGNEFAAIILRNDIWKPIMNTGDNVVLWDEKANSQYHWLFKKQSDGSYIIQSLYDGKVMDVYGGYTASGTNVQVYKQHGEDNGAQKWFIYGSINSYKLVPKNAQSMCLDVQGMGSANGTNIQIYESNGTVAQQFAIYKISHNALKSISITLGYDNTMYAGKKQTLMYTLSPSDTKSNMVTWSSSDSSVLEVNSEGVVIAKQEGEATITCTSTYDSNISASVTINVRKEEPITQQPTTEELKTEEPTTQEPAQEESETEEPTTQEPAQEESETEEPTTQEPVQEESEPEEPTTQQPVTEETEEEESITQQPVTDEHEEEVDNEATNEELDNTENFDDEYEEEDELEDSEWDEPEAAEIGTILKDSKNKCKVEVTCNVEGCLMVDYVGSTKKKAKNIKVPNNVTIDGVTYKVTGIAEGAFSENNKLTKVSLGNNIQWIGDNAFRNCKKLKSIVLPKSVKSIGKNTFRNCKNLKKITIKGTVLTSVGKNAFKGTCKKMKLEAPKSKKKAYKKMLKKAGCKM